MIELTQEMAGKLTINIHAVSFMYSNFKRMNTAIASRLIRMILMGWTKITKEDMEVTQKFIDNNKDKFDNENNLKLETIKELRDKLDEISKDIFNNEEDEIENRGTNLLTVTNYTENTNIFYNRNPFFYDTNGLFWLWDYNQSKYKKVDKVQMLKVISDELTLSGEVINSNIKNNYLTAFQIVGRAHIPKKFPNTWVQFGDDIFDIKTGEKLKATPEYFVTNPIPWKVGKSNSTPTIDKLFHEWVVKEGLQDETWVQTLYEVVTYSCLSTQFLQRIIALTGSGSNGKGCFLNLINKFLGSDNICTSELRVLSTKQFETSALYKKLVCLMGEVSAYDLKDTKLIKQLSGEDLIRYEFKGKTPFTETSYVTCIIATNSLPIPNDQSIGFKRRWLIIDFPHEFPIGGDIISKIPNEEFNNLALKCVEVAKQLFNDNKFTNEGTIEERGERYNDRSNPIEKFIENECIVGEGKEMKLKDFTEEFNEFLKNFRLRPVSSKAVAKILRNDGYSVGTKNDYINGHTTFVCVFGIITKKADEKTITIPNDNLGEISQLDEDFQ